MTSQQVISSNLSNPSPDIMGIEKFDRDKYSFRQYYSIPLNIATISAGFEKGYFLVREEKGLRVYFDFFEEAFNYISNKGYARMGKEEEEEWCQLIRHANASIKGGIKYNMGKLLLVMSRPTGKGRLSKNMTKSMEESEKQHRSPNEVLDDLQSFTGDGMI